VRSQGKRGNSQGEERRLGKGEEQMRQGEGIGEGQKERGYASKREK
jgi:hypothetical protein